MNRIERQLFFTIIRSLEADAQRGRILAERLTTENATAFCLAMGWGAANGIKWLARINEELFRSALAELGVRYELGAAQVIRQQNLIGQRALDAVRSVTRAPGRSTAGIPASAFHAKSVHGAAPSGDLPH